MLATPGSLFMLSIYISVGSRSKSTEAMVHLMVLVFIYHPNSCLLNQNF